MERLTKLHLGSGKHPWPGYINIDQDERADEIGDVTALDYADNSVDEIHAVHLFEHLNRMQAPKVLSDWHRVLKPGGKLVLELPCMEKIAQMIVDGETRVGFTLFGIFGDIRLPNPLMRHQWCYTSTELADLMKQTGFEVEVLEPVYHVKQRDMRLEGVKK